MTTAPPITEARRLFVAGHSVRQIAGRLGVPAAEVEGWRKAKLPDGKKWERKNHQRAGRKTQGASKRHTDVTKPLDKPRRDLEDTFAKIRAGDDGTTDLCKLLDAHATGLLARKDEDGKTRLTQLDPDSLSRVSSVVAQAQAIKRTAAKAALYEAKELIQARAEAERIKLTRQLERDELDDLTEEETDQVIRYGVMPARHRRPAAQAGQAPASASGVETDAP